MGRHAITLAASALVMVLLLVPASLELVLGAMFPASPGLVYPLQPPLVLAADHLAMVLLTSLAASILGFSGALAVFVSRSASLQRLISLTGTTLQTMPPMAILALMVPFAGFGTTPVVYALIVFGILPVFHYSLAALIQVSPAAIDAGRGLGFSSFQVFTRIQLPLSAPGILAGIRTSVMVNMGTATIGATMGAGGLGRPIIAGLSQFTWPWLVQGALTAALMAFMADTIFALWLAGLRARSRRLDA